ncbi:MAG: ABC transporter ATP-binding protein [Betaproteobacteria bacterium]
MLDIQNLRVRFGAFPAVDGVDLHVDAGEVLGIVGESGSGKSVSMMGLMGLISAPGVVTADRCRFLGHDLLTLSDRERRRVVGRDVAMVFQDALTALNPSYTVGFQIEEVLKLHLGLKGRAARERAVALLEQVEIPDAARRLQAYPHELSGGMRQRAMIALALACRPQLLLADEPTTALDATVQIQILLLLRELQREMGLSIVFVTHDIGAAVEVADRIAVMYAGRIVEEGPARTLIRAPRHPYTMALLRSRAHGALARGARLQTIAGSPPDLAALPPGCAFAERCAFAQDACRGQQPAAVVLAADHQARCLRTDATAAAAA